MNRRSGSCRRQRIRSARGWMASVQPPPRNVSRDVFGYGMRYKLGAVVQRCCACSASVVDGGRCSDDSDRAVFLLVLVRQIPLPGVLEISQVVTLVNTITVAYVTRSDAVPTELAGQRTGRLPGKLQAQARSATGVKPQRADPCTRRRSGTPTAGPLPAGKYRQVPQKSRGGAHHVSGAVARR